jgi:hypothetical protein
VTERLLVVHCPDWPVVASGHLATGDVFGGPDPQNCHQLGEAPVVASGHLATGDVFGGPDPQNCHQLGAAKVAVVFANRVVACSEGARA